MTNKPDDLRPILILLLVATFAALGSLIWAQWTWTKEIRLDLLAGTVVAALIPPAVAVSLGLLSVPPWVRLPLIVLANITVRPLAALVRYVRSSRQGGDHG